MRLVTYLLINGIAIFLASQILAGVHVSDFLTAIIIAVILGTLNFSLKPLLIILTLPLTILTLGLFTFVIHLFIFYLVDILIAGFKVDGLLWLVLFSIITSLISSFLNRMVKQ